MTVIETSRFGLKFLYDSEKQVYIVEDNGTTIVTDDALFACSIFYGRCDAACRRRIGDMYERQGRSRWTGKPLSVSQTNTVTNSM